MIGLIWAQASDRGGRPVIGVDNTIPWRVREDFAHFKATTSGHPVVMGRRTWESLPKRPLPGRTNVILTSGDVDEVDSCTTVEVAASLDEALALAAQASGAEEIWVMGGSRVYADAITIADRLEVTEIALETDGDTFAPRIDPTIWHPTDTTAWHTSSTPPHLSYRHRTYTRHP